jgi:hypothetical protein
MMVFIVGYLMTLSVTRIYSIKCQMNWRGFERRSCSLTEVLLWHFSGGTEESHEGHVRIAGVLAEISTGHPLNMGLKH